VDALLTLEGTDRFGGVGGFVNVSRHRDNLLVNGLGAFLFGKTNFRSDFGELGEGGLEVFHDFGGDDVGIRHDWVLVPFHLIEIISRLCCFVHLRIWSGTKERKTDTAA